MIGNTDSQDTIKQEEAKKKLIDLAYEVEEELSKEKVDEEKLFKLRYAQMVQGLYLQYPN